MLDVVLREAPYDRLGIRRPSRKPVANLISSSYCCSIISDNALQRKSATFKVLRFPVAPRLGVANSVGDQARV